MKLAFKLFAINLIVIIALLTIDSYFLHLKRVAAFKNNMMDHNLLIRHALVPVLQQTWRHEGHVGQWGRFIDSLSSKNITMHWHWVVRDGQKVAHDKDFYLDRVARSHDDHFNDFLDLEKDEWSVFTLVSLDEHNKGVLEIKESLAPLKGFSRIAILRTIALTLAMILLGAVVTGLFGYFLIAVPIKQLKVKAQKIGRADGAARRVKVQGTNELKELSDVLDELDQAIQEGKNRIKKAHQERLAMVQQLRHTDRLKTVGGLASGIAHELGTPLNVILGRAGLIGSGTLTAQEMRESVEVIRSEAKRMAAIIQELLNFAGRRPSAIRPVSLNKTLTDVVALIQPIIKKKNITVLSKLAPKLPMFAADENQIKQVFTNLLVNAVDALSNNGQIILSSRRMMARNPHKPKAKRRRYLVVNIEDNGCGMSQEVQAKAFDPFFTTKDVGQGTGLGLSIVHGIVTEYQGFVTIKSTLGVGTTVGLYFPEVGE